MLIESDTVLLLAELTREDQIENTTVVLIRLQDKSPTARIVTVALSDYRRKRVNYSH